MKTTRDRLLDELRRSEVDLAAARARVEERAGARRRRRRIASGVAGVAAVLVVVFVAAVALTDDNPDDVLADGSDRPTTTTAPSSTTSTTTSATSTDADPVLPVETTEVPATVVPTTTAPAPASVAPTLPADSPPPPIPTPATPSTLVVNSPMSATLVVATPRVPSGSTTAIDITWSDADHSGVAPTYLVDWGDPAIGATPPAAPVGTCDLPGRPAGATDRVQFRHATPGRHRISVELRTCAQGEFAERLVLEGTVEVVEPELDGAPGVAVVLHREDTAAPAPLLPALDSADARLGDRLLPARGPVLSQRVGRGAATVVVLPRDADDDVTLSWPSTDCRASTPVDLAGVEPVPAPRFLLSSAC